MMRWFLPLIGIHVLISAAGAASFLEGRVLDEQGRPVVGASVKIWDCIGTCLGGKTVLTDEKGDYVFDTKPYRNHPLLAVSMPGRYEVSRKQAGPALHDSDTETQRRVDFVLGSPAAASVRIDGNPAKGWTQSLIIRPGRDTKVRRYDKKGLHDDGWHYWNFELLPRRENLHLVIVCKPVVVPSDDKKEMKKRKQQAWREKVEIVSPGFQLPDPQRYNIRAKLVDAESGEKPYIEVEAITDAIGTDRTEELLQADSMFGPPVNADARQQALDLLKRVKVNATPWNALPPQSVTSYEYDAVMKDGEVIHVQRNQDSSAGPSWTDISRVRGFAHMPTLRWLYSQPDNVVFHSVNISQKQATLHYRLKSGRGFSAGLGVGPGWNGFFTTSFNAGRIVIDVPTATVSEHRMYRKLLGEESVVTYRDYTLVDAGYAPSSIRIQHGNFDMRLTFEIHKDKLWLLKQASHGEDEPSIRIENVNIKLAE